MSTTALVSDEADTLCVGAAADLPTPSPPIGCLPTAAASSILVVDQWSST
jgi:hypothetical protein